MDDQEILDRIHHLVDEEHRLHTAHVGDGLAAEDVERLKSLEVQLDQCWDLLRQRRARRDVGESPLEAHARPADVVERYQQ